MSQDAVLRLCRCPPKGSWLLSSDVIPQILLEGNACDPAALFRTSASAVCCSRHRISCRRRLESLILHVCTPFSDVSEIPYVNYFTSEYFCSQYPCQRLQFHMLLLSAYFLGSYSEGNGVYGGLIT